MKKLNTNKDKFGGFKVPDNYFETFSANLISKIYDETSNKTLHPTGFKTPDGYFENLNTNMRIPTTAQKGKVKPLFQSNNLIIKTIAIAATVILILVLSINKDEEINFSQLEVASIENYILNSEVNTSDIAQYITEDDLTNSFDLMTAVNEENLENYLINNADLETLLIN